MSSVPHDPSHEDAKTLPEPHDLEPGHDTMIIHQVKPNEDGTVRLVFDDGRGGLFPFTIHPPQD